MEHGPHAMQACLTKDPHERLSAEALLQHDWIPYGAEGRRPGHP